MATQTRQHARSLLNDHGRLIRFVEFLAVGASGVAVDLAVTITTLPHTHYLFANFLGFLLAVTWNFGGNWLITYNRPDGDLGWQYVSYVSLHALTFGVRALILVFLVELTPTPLTIAILIGIGAAALLNFGGTERIFGGDGSLWFDAIAATNHLAHAVYSSRLRSFLQITGLYPILYGIYVRAFGLLYRANTHTVTVAETSGTYHMESAPEVVSVLHTLEKERDTIDEFLEAVDAGDVVWDVGANLGVYAILAARAGATVHAFEPHEPTHSRLVDNAGLNGAGIDCRQHALGDTSGTATLHTERADVGTQTGHTTTDGRENGETVQVWRGNLLIDKQPDVQPPDILKIDVEGAEQAVLDGLGHYLSECRHIFCETHDAAETAEIKATLADAGYEIAVVQDSHETHLHAMNPEANNE